MEQQIIDILKKNNHKYIKIETQESIQTIFNLFVNAKFNDESRLNDIELFYYGVYYQFINIDYNLMKKYYLMAIQHGDSTSMNNLGWYYHEIDEDYDLTKKYYLMVIQHDQSSAMTNLGSHYGDIEKNYDLMKKYYLMAIEHGDSGAMNNLGWYYENIEQNYNLAKKYYLMAIHHGDSIAMYNLGQYYGHVEKDYVLLKKYYLMAIQHGETRAMHNLGWYYKNVEQNYNLMKKYYLMAIEHGDNRTISSLNEYYDNAVGDYSFLELHNNLHFKEKVFKWINKRFASDICLPKEYIKIFWRLEFNDEISKKIRIKQYILKKTGVFPHRSTRKYIIEFMELLSLSSYSNCVFCKDIMMMIASHLFT